ncbi:MAG: hypothetical protein ACLFUH_07535 [Bacteroidales bacterium]
MKLRLIFNLLILLGIFSAANAGDNNSIVIAEEDNIVRETNLPSAYQEFRYSFLNMDNQAKKNPLANFQFDDDYFVLYIAGGIAVATTAIVLLNDPGQYENCIGQTNTGIIIGGGIMSSLLVAKYFIDESR